MDKKEMEILKCKGEIKIGGRGGGNS